MSIVNVNTYFCDLTDEELDSAIYDFREAVHLNATKVASIQHVSILGIRAELADMEAEKADRAACTKYWA